MQIPYQPFTTATPSERGPSGLSISTPPAAFGENIAQALSRVGAATDQFGKVEQHVGDELFARALALQNLRNETEAKEADAKYMIQAGQLHAEYGAKEGKDAVAAFPKYQQDLQEARQNIRGSLSNDAARRMFDASALSTMSRSIFNGAGHAATENKRYALGASSARVEAKQDVVYASPDKATRDDALTTVEEEIRHQGDIRGWSPEQTEEAVRKGKSSTLAHYITGLAKNKAFEAGDALEAHKTDLRPEDYEKVKHTVEAQQNIHGSRNIADEVTAPMMEGDPKKPEESLDSMLKRGRERAKEIAPGNPELSKYVEDAIKNRWNTHKASTTDAEQRAEATLIGSILPHPDSKLPQNFDQLMAIPGNREAFDSMSKPKQYEWFHKANNLGKLPTPNGGAMRTLLKALSDIINYDRWQ